MAGQRVDRAWSSTTVRTNGPGVYSPPPLALEVPLLLPHMMDPSVLRLFLHCSLSSRARFLFRAMRSRCASVKEEDDKADDETEEDDDDDEEAWEDEEEDEEKDDDPCSDFFARTAASSSSIAFIFCAMACICFAISAAPGLAGAPALPGEAAAAPLSPSQPSLVAIPGSPPGPQPERLSRA